MASWSVYIVRCCDGSLYTGVSNDVPARVQRHNDGKGARYTRSRRPVALVWRRRVKDKSAALRLEAALK
ncbi:MAG: Excinuclease subunit-like protein, partial [Myxococcaceae bacterium]|nr:Excinuclease subunit-like protein [Myxococcaceae bacterium]